MAVRVTKLRYVNEGLKVSFSCLQCCLCMLENALVVCSIVGCDKDLMTISPRHVDSSESKFKVTNCSRRSTNDDWCTLPDPLLENRSTSKCQVVSFINFTSIYYSPTDLLLHEVFVIRSLFILLPL